MKIALLISIVFLTSCFSASNEKFNIDKSIVDFIEIRKRVDTVSLRLSESQFENLIAKLQSSEPGNPSKVFAQYHLTFHLNDGSELSFTTNQDIVRAQGGRTYSIGDKEYFKKIWFQQAGLTEDYHEYFPTYRKDGEIIQVTKTMDSYNLENIKQVLTEYGHKWIDIRGVLFYKGNLSDELLADYTSKAGIID